MKKERLKKLKLKEDQLIKKFAKSWDPKCVKAPRGETLNLYLAALDDGEADAIKPLRELVQDLQVGRMRVISAVIKDRNPKKDPRTPAMAEFLTNTDNVEAQLADIIATKNEGVQYTRLELVAFARSADELTRTRKSILRGKKLKQAITDDEYWNRVLPDVDLMRVRRTLCQLSICEKGILLGYPKEGTGKTRVEQWILLKSAPIPQYVQIAQKQRRKTEREADFSDAVTFNNPVAAGSGKQANLVSFILDDVFEIQDDGDVDSEKLQYTFRDDDPSVLKQWMQCISDAQADFAKNANTRRKDAKIMAGILTLVIPNEHAPAVTGWRSHLPTACNGLDDENDADEPDLRSASGRCFRRFEKVKADLELAKAELSPDIPSDIETRAEQL